MKRYQNTSGTARFQKDGRPMLADDGLPWSTLILPFVGGFFFDNGTPEMEILMLTNQDFGG